MLALVTAASRATGETPDQLLEGFGRLVVPDLVGRTEATIHMRERRP